MCQHETFNTTAKITRLADRDDGPVTGFLLELTVTCAQCSKPFTFRGMRQGLLSHEPTSSTLKERARIPIEPMDEETLGVYRRLYEDKAN